MKVVINVKGLHVLASIGRDSLHYYIFHIFIFMDILKPLSDYLNIGFIWLIIYSFFIIIILYCFSYLPFFRYALNPLSNIYIKWKNQ